VKTSAFDLQTNQQHPGLQMHRIDKSRDPNFLSVRANADVRIILHKTEASLLLAMSTITTRRGPRDGVSRRIRRLAQSRLSRSASG
jgi:hypothetical protein